MTIEERHRFSFSYKDADDDMEIMCYSRLSKDYVPPLIEGTYLVDD